MRSVQVEGTAHVKAQREEGLKVKILKGGHCTRESGQEGKRQIIIWTRPQAM